MSLVPAVTELILAELLYLQYDNPNRPVYMYINSAGVTVSSSRNALWLAYRPPLPDNEWVYLIMLTLQVFCAVLLEDVLSCASSNGDLAPGAERWRKTGL